MEEIYLCISRYGNQSIKKNPANDYFANYDNDVVMIKLSEDVIKELKGVKEE